MSIALPQPTLPTVLRDGQTWARGDEQAMISGVDDIRANRDTAFRVGVGSGFINTDGLLNVVNANGWRLVVGPGLRG